MDYQLENEYLKVDLSTVGAEMTSIKSKEGIEYLWCGDKEYWGRHAPVLFPIVGKVLDNKYCHTHEGISKEYHISQHGFARDNEFKVTSKETNRIEFLLESNEVTKEKYPFDFALKLIYELHKNSIKLSYVIENKGQETMYFSIGGHPAFYCPLMKGECLEDYYIEFEQEEVAKKLFITPEVYFSGEVVEYPVKKIVLSRAFFEEGVTVLMELASEYVMLKSTKHNHSVTVSIKDFPFLGIWQPEKGAPFVCIEPWIGHTDYVDDSQELKEKKDVVALGKGQSNSYSYTMTFE